MRQKFTIIFLYDAVDTNFNIQYEKCDFPTNHQIRYMRAFIRHL